MPKEQGRKRHKWRCIYCREVFQCKPSLNYHRLTVCSTEERPLKQYPILDKGQRIVMKEQQAIVKGRLGKGKGHMASVEEDGIPHIIRDRMEVDDQFLRDTGTHQAPVMTTPIISNLLLEERGVSSSGERGPVCNLGVFEGTETIDTTGLAMGSENHEHVEVKGDGEGHALEVEDEELSWSPVFCQLRDIPEFHLPDDGEGHALEVEDEEWGWSPLFCLLRDFPEHRPLDFPHRPWKHTIEEFDVIRKFLKDRQARRTKPLRPPLIVLALKATWHFHFGRGSSIIQHYPKLVEKLEDVSQDKEFVDNLSRMQHLMRTKDGSMTSYAKILFLTIPDDYKDDEQPTLEDDVSSFKAASELHEHKEVVERVLDWLIRITYCGMQDSNQDWNFFLRNMWCSQFSPIGKGFIIDHSKDFCSCWESSYTGFTPEEVNGGEDSLPYL